MPGVGIRARFVGQPGRLPIEEWQSTRLAGLQRLYRRSMTAGARRSALSGRRYNFIPANPSHLESGGSGDHPLTTRATIRRSIVASTTPGRPVEQSGSDRVALEYNAEA